MGKMTLDTTVFGGYRPSASLFRKKNEKTVFRYGKVECVYQISGPYRFSFGQEAWNTLYIDTHIYE